MSENLQVFTGLFIVLVLAVSVLHFAGQNPSGFLSHTVPGGQPSGTQPSKYPYEQGPPDKLPPLTGGDPNLDNEGFYGVRCDPDDKNDPKWSRLPSYGCLGDTDACAQYECQGEDKTTLKVCAETATVEGFGKAKCDPAGYCAYECYACTPCVDANRELLEFTEEETIIVEKGKPKDVPKPPPAVPPKPKCDGRKLLQLELMMKEAEENTEKSIIKLNQYLNQKERELNEEMDKELRELYKNDKDKGIDRKNTEDRAQRIRDRYKEAIDSLRKDIAQREGEWRDAAANLGKAYDAALAACGYGGSGSSGGASGSGKLVLAGDKPTETVFTPLEKDGGAGDSSEKPTETVFTPIEKGGSEADIAGTSVPEIYQIKEPLEYIILSFDGEAGEWEPLITTQILSKDKAYLWVVAFGLPADYYAVVGIESKTEDSIILKSDSAKYLKLRKKPEDPTKPMFIDLKFTNLPVVPQVRTNLNLLNPESPVVTDIYSDTKAIFRALDEEALPYVLTEEQIGQKSSSENFFDGFGTHLAVPTGFGLNKDAFTISVKLKPSGEQYQPFATVYRQENEDRTTDFGLNLNQEGGINAIVEDNGETYILKSPWALPADIDTYITVTVKPDPEDASRLIMRMYFNGYPVAQEEFSAQIGETEKPAYIGTDGGLIFFRGDIKWVKVFDEPLEQEEVNKLIEEDVEGKIPV